MQRIIGLALSFMMLSACISDYTVMTEIPERYVFKPDFVKETSEIGVRVSASNSMLQAALSELDGQRVSASDGPNLEIATPTILKTNNPLYNPVKWIKTKNPTYNPQKWIKVCTWLGCVKTKNPLYDPKKWIKTKNPLYDPKKFIEVKASYAFVSGYNFNATVADAPIYTPNGINGFNITFPVKLDGDITLIAPPLPPFVGNKFSGTIEFDADFSVKPRADWCADLGASFDYHWIKPLKLDIFFNTGVLEVDVTDLVKPQLQDALDDWEDSIARSLDCVQIRNQAQEVWQQREYQVSSELFAILNPKKARLSHLSFDDEQIVLNAALEFDATVTDNPSSIPAAGPLPDLVFNDPDVNPGISLSVPLRISYAKLDSNLEEALVDKPISLGNGDDLPSATLFIKDIQTYPHGPEIGLRMAFEIESSIPALRIKAVAYFTGAISHSGNNKSVRIEQMFDGSHFLVYSINNVAFNEFGNGADRLILALAYNEIRKAVIGERRIDITDEMAELERDLLRAANEIIFEYHEPRRQNPGETDPQSLRLACSEISFNNWLYDEENMEFLIKARALPAGVNCPIAFVDGHD